MSPNARRVWRSYGLAILLSSVALLITISLPLAPERAPLLVLLLTAVAISAWHGGSGPGLLAFLFSALGLIIVGLPNGPSGRLESDAIVRLYLFTFSAAIVILLAESRQEANRRAEQARHLAEEEARRFTRLQRVTAALSDAVTPDDVSRVIVDQGLATLGAVAGGIGLLGADGETFVLARRFGYPSPEAVPGRLPMTELGLISETLKTGQPLFFVDQADLARRFPDYASVARPADGGLAILPMLAEGQPLGALGARFRQPHVFNEADRRDLVTLAQQGAQALERARLYEDEQRARAQAEAARRRVEFVAQISTILLSSFDYQERLETLTRHLVPALGDSCLIYTVRPDGVSLAAMSHVDATQEARLREGIVPYPTDLSTLGPLGEMLVSGQSFVMSPVDFSALSALAPEATSLRLAEAVGVRSLLVVPLSASGRFLGFLALLVTEANRLYTQDDVALAEEVARRAAAALENARLLATERVAYQAAEQAAERVLRLQAVTAALSQAATTDEVAEVVIQHGQEALGADAVALALLRAEAQQYEVVRAVGYPPALMERYRFYPVDAPLPAVEAVRRRETLIFPSIEAVRQSFPHLPTGQTDFQAWAAVPLVAADGPLGSLNLAFRTPRPFTAEDTVFLSTLGEQCAQALERARLYDNEQQARAQAEAARRRVEFVAQASAALIASLDFQARLDQLAHLAIPTLGDGCVVYTVQDGVLAPVASAHMLPAKDAFLRASLPSYPANLDLTTPAGQALAAGQPFVVSAIDPALLAPKPDESESARIARQLGLRSVLFVPLIAFGRFCGMIDVFITESERLYTADDVTLAQEVARRAAVALENARLLETERAAHQAAEQAAERVRRLQSVTAALSQAATTDEVAQVVVHEGQAALGAEAVALALLSSDGQEFEVVSAVGYSEEALAHFRRYPADANLPATEAVRRREILAFETSQAILDAFPHMVSPRSEARAWAAVPLVTANGPVGSLNLTFCPPHPFSPDELTFLATLGEQCAQALERARLYETEQQARAQAEAARRRVEFIAQASAVLLSSLNYEDRLRRLLRVALPTLGDGCHIFALNLDGHLSLVAATHIDPTKARLLKAGLRDYPPDLAGQGPLADRLRAGETVVIAPVDSNVLPDLFRHPATERLFAEMGLTALVNVPFQIFGRFLGFMAFYITEADRHYTPEDVALAEEVARRAAIAVENARLLGLERQARGLVEESAARVRRLQGITAALSQAVTFDEVADIIVHEGYTTLGASGGTLTLLTPDGAEFETVRAVGYPPEVMARWRRYPASMPTPAAEAVATRRPIVFESPEDAARRYPDLVNSQGGFKAWALAPLISGAHVLGILDFAFPTPRQFSAEDISFLTTLAEQCAQALERARLYDNEQQARAQAETARRRIEFVAQVNTALSASLDYQTRLARLTEEVLPRLGDACVVHLIHPEGDIELAAFAHVIPEKEAALQAFLSEDGGGMANPESTLYRALLAGQALMISPLDADALARLISDPDRRAQAAALSPTAAMFIPLSAFGRFLGVMTLFITETQRGYTADDLSLAEEVARRAAVALDNARLYELERDAHRTAERGAGRIRRLQAVTAALSQAVTLDAVADVIVDEGTTTVEAEAGFLCLLTPDHRELEIVRARGYTDDLLARWHVFSVDQSIPAAVAVKRRQIVTVESVANAAPDYPDLVASRSGYQAWAVAPLISGDQVIGSIGFSFSAPREFSAEDVSLLATLGEQCAQAIVRARLYEAEQQARAEADAAAQRINLLYGASSSLAESLDMGALLRTLAQLTVPAVADWCVVDLVTTGYWTHGFIVAHVDPAKEALAKEMMRRFPPQPGFAPGLKMVLETGLPFLVPEVTPDLLAARAQNDEHLELLRYLGPTSYLILPLIARGQLLGIMSLAMTEGRRFAAADQEIAQELARRAAVFIDNARLYQETRNAVAARQAVLAVVSHDLRNPLAVIKGYAALMERSSRGLDESLRARFVDRIKRIDAVIMRMNGMIDELSDFSRIQIGQPLDLELVQADLVHLARQVVEEQRQTSKAHSIHLHAAVTSLMVDVDLIKMARVLTNIIGNAIKYSPEGGRIDVRVSADQSAGDGWAVVEVQDQGAGILAEDLPYIFEFYRRGSNVGRSVRGAGIGLATAEYVVKQHGGQIQVESQVGVGSTFTVRLPLSDSHL